MGAGVLIGSIIGSFGSQSLSEESINMVYGVLALIAAVMMFIPKKGIDDIPLDKITFNKWLAMFLALIVGLGSGIVGAGGGFLIVPIMLVVLKIPTRVTIASSLAIIFISSMGATAGKISTGQVDFYPALILVIASIIAATWCKDWEENEYKGPSILISHTHFNHGCENLDGYFIVRN